MERAWKLDHKMLKVGSFVENLMRLEVLMARRGLLFSSSCSSAAVF
jgi:hypothetical protein